MWSTRIKITVSRQAVSKWETRECEPDTRISIELARFFEISLDELFNVNTKQVEDIKKMKKYQKLMNRS